MILVAIIHQVSYTSIVIHTWSKLARLERKYSKPLLLTNYCSRSANALKVGFHAKKICCVKPQFLFVISIKQSIRQLCADTVAANCHLWLGLKKVSRLCLPRNSRFTFTFYISIFIFKFSMPFESWSYILYLPKTRHVDNKVKCLQPWLISAILLQPSWGWFIKYNWKLADTKYTYKELGIYREKHW